LSLIAPRIERQIHARGAAGVEKFLDTRVAGVDALIEANLKPVASSRIGVDQAPGERHVRLPGSLTAASMISRGTDRLTSMVSPYVVP
jgi:hypothetical protein